MESVTVHGARSTNTFSARSSEGKSRIKVFLDIDERIKIQGGHFFEIDVIADVFGLIFGIFRIVLVDQETFHGGFLFRGEGWIMLSDIVRIHVTLNS